MLCSYKNSANSLTDRATDGLNVSYTDSIYSQANSVDIATITTNEAYLPLQHETAVFIFGTIPSEQPPLTNSTIMTPTLAPPASFLTVARLDPSMMGSESYRYPNSTLGPEAGNALLAIETNLICLQAMEPTIEQARSHGSIDAIAIASPPDSVSLAEQLYSYLTDTLGAVIPVNARTYSQTLEGSETSTFMFKIQPGIRAIQVEAVDKQAPVFLAPPPFLPNEPDQMASDPWTTMGEQEPSQEVIWTYGNGAN